MRPDGQLPDCRSLPTPDDCGPGFQLEEVGREFTDKDEPAKLGSQARRAIRPLSLDLWGDAYQALHVRDWTWPRIPLLTSGSVNETRWFAHSLRESDRSRWEPLRTHLWNVEAIAREFGKKFDAGEFGAVLGLLHDLGKYDERFLSRLAGENIQHDHSTGGACIVSENYGRIGKLLAYAIAGHHAGLANGIRDEREDSARRPLQERLKDGTEQARAALSRAQADGIELPTVAPPVFRPSSNTLKGFQLALFGRMLFSCLVDADFLETERFYAEAGEIVVEREKFPPLPQLLPAFDNYLSRKIAPLANTSSLNRLRAHILEHARARARQIPRTVSPRRGGCYTSAPISRWPSVGAASAL